MDEQQLYELALKKWGHNAQVLMMFEEMAELQKVICHAGRGNRTFNKAELIDELVDVGIMLGQMRILFNITEQELLAAKSAKLGRLANRLIKEKGDNNLKR